MLGLVSFYSCVDALLLTPLISQNEPKRKEECGGPIYEVLIQSKFIRIKACPVQKCGKYSLASSFRSTYFLQCKHTLSSRLTNLQSLQ